MRIWILSDLHLEFAPIEALEPPRGADVCVIAGDVLTGGIVPSIEWISQNLARHLPVIFVPGNHEYYRSFMVESLVAARIEAEKHPNVHLLEMDTVLLNGVLFAGTTFWTDFSLLSKNWTELAMRHCGTAMSDYSKIKLSKRPYAKLRPIDTWRFHRAARDFIVRFLSLNRDRTTVVVTHHAPSTRSIDPALLQDLTSCAYASDYDDLISAKGPRLWVHGHVHNSLHYTIGDTMIACNPRGYPGERTFARFQRGFTVDI